LPQPSRAQEQGHRQPHRQLHEQRRGRGRGLGRASAWQQPKLARHLPLHLPVFQRCCRWRHLHDGVLHEAFPCLKSSLHQYSARGRVGPQALLMLQLMWRNLLLPRQRHLLCSQTQLLRLLRFS
jgi:hypothetical protein